MKSRNPAQFLAAALALVGFGAASTAQAGSDLYFSIGVQAPGYYSQPAPVYVQPRSYYVQPQSVYVQPRPVYVQPQPVYLPRIQSAPAAVYQDRWSYYEQERRATEWRHWNRKHHKHHKHDQHHGRDRDWDRDGD